MEKNRDVSLDILRVFACLMVFGVHFVNHVDLKGTLGLFFEKGSTGVGFFFILSGYLACFSMESASKKFGNKLQAARYFWIKRLSRILPLYYLIVLFYFLFHTVTGTVPQDETGLGWLRYVLMINTWVPAEKFFWVNLGAVWSISSFVFFYLIAPIYYYAVNDYFIAWVGVVIGYALMKASDIMGWSYIPIRSLFYFFLGILVFVACRKGYELSMTVILSFIVLFCFLSGAGNALVAPFLAALYLLATRKMDIRVTENNIAIKAVLFISMISYSIYLDHVAIIDVMDYVGVKPGVVYAAVLIVLTLALSVVTQKYVEEKLGGFIAERLLGKKK